MIEKRSKRENKQCTSKRRAVLLTRNLIVSTGAATVKSNMPSKNTNKKKNNSDKIIRAKDNWPLRGS